MIVAQRGFLSVMSAPLVMIAHSPGRSSYESIERSLLGYCQQNGIDCLLMPDFYHLPATSRAWQKIADRLVGGGVLFCMHHPRAAEWVLRSHRIEVERCEIVNMASLASAEAAIAMLADRCRGTASSVGNVEQIKATTHKRWYPVIDGSRCVHCQHCLQFCLFGVYETEDDGKVVVRNPDQCKPGCPACSRICPQGAIMFPLYEDDRAIAGAPGQTIVLDAAARRMFYSRTKQPCPVCGQKATARSARKKPSGPLCPECGQPSAAQTVEKTQQDALPFDDLDDLVEQLDQKMRRGS